MPFRPSPLAQTESMKYPCGKVPDRHLNKLKISATIYFIVKYTVLLTSLKGLKIALTIEASNCESINKSSNPEWVEYERNNLFVL